METKLPITTLADQIEEKLFEYIKKNNLVPGDSLPNEMQFAEMMGISRSVVREAISRLKMIGIIETRTRKGMVLKEPSLFDGMKRVINPLMLGEDPMFDILGFRVALEMGICDDIFNNITKQDIKDLEEIIKVEVVLKDNEYALMSECMFHSKLYQITSNKTIGQFQELIRPIIIFIKNNFQDIFKPINMRLQEQGLIVTHTDIVNSLKSGDFESFREAYKNHFIVYKIFLKERKERMKDSNKE